MLHSTLLVESKENNSLTKYCNPQSSLSQM